jgi:hypothetical protein
MKEVMRCILSPEAMEKWESEREERLQKYNSRRPKDNQ